MANLLLSANPDERADDLAEAEAEYREVIALEDLPQAEYRAIMAELFAHVGPGKYGFVCTFCPDAQPHIHGV